ncbi:NUDIX domain-containing protein [Longimicrobium terrae]|uniref:8-oxo-dGTP pyrophosphatase MutT (NUDIX family) n=1 Tax=Longimicrobium terrae TaxID=1639882 RepID=A0A841GXD9_9BACT|nr:8-oxo-dGTP pyrophosphatase MutT (NUDIX family) [Longimicrobium terrae]MBB6070076.1 8-oxo-dGTP pyrophosphatase MutT (NUDIX family) [Longimicrobium terrae]NNC32980.1 NUDIX hydrolase [Longimicrobium terrae]
MNVESSLTGTPVQCAAIPYRLSDGVAEVLLVTRRSGEGWIVPKGKIEPGLGPRESARREAFEEAGVEGDIGTQPFDHYRHGREDGPLVVAFLLRVTREMSSWPEAKERQRAWVPLDDVQTRLTDPGLSRVLRAVAAHLDPAQLAAAPADARNSSSASRTAGASRGISLFRSGLVLVAVLGLIALAARVMFPHGEANGGGNGATASDDKDGRKKGGKKKDKDKGGEAGPVAAAGLAAAGVAGADPGLCRADGSGMQMPADVHESSGVAAGRRTAGVLWTHNDSGEPVLFAISPRGQETGQVRIAGARVQDWEDIAAGPCPGGNCLYIGDIGDNAGARPGITVYRVAEPAPTDRESRPADAFPATYPDGPHDTEALFVLPEGGMFVVSKGETGPIALYRFPSTARPGSSSRLERVVELAGAGVKRKERITGASASPDGRWVALRTLSSVSFYRAADLIAGRPGNPLVYDLTPLDEAQGEGIGWSTNGAIYLTSEGGRKSAPSTLARLTCTLPS